VWLIVHFLYLGAIAQTGVAEVADPLLAIDQHRTTVVERIVGEWGDKLATERAGVNREHLREMRCALTSCWRLASPDRSTACAMCSPPR
jgi:hypothetical protein